MEAGMSDAYVLSGQITGLVINTTFSQEYVSVCVVNKMNLIYLTDASLVLILIVFGIAMWKLVSYRKKMKCEGK